MSTTVTELQFLHDAYIAKVNAAVEAGDDQLADELSVAYSREAATASQAHAA
jgi:hypothetical protein